MQNIYTCAPIQDELLRVKGKETLKMLNYHGVLLHQYLFLKTMLVDKGIKKNLS